MPTALTAGSSFPSITVPKVGGGTLDLAGSGGDWRMVIVYRGKHCPLCVKYFRQLEDMKDRFTELGVEVVAVSADPEGKASAFIEESGTSVPIGYDLTLDQMAELGLYISDPRSPEETDRPFAEPGLFVLNSEGKVQILDISNAPFARPDLNVLIGGITFVRGNDYPIRGMH